MKTIKININPNSSTGEAFKKYLEEKAAFKQAVTTGSINSFVKKNGKKFDTPVQTGK